MKTVWKYLWAGPWTIIGLIIGCVNCCFKGKAIIRFGTIGFYGPLVCFLLSRMPISGGALAITLGHSILAKDLPGFQSSFGHELVHVRQYERWGIMFVPAYFFASFWQWRMGKHYYWDNPFEKEAREQEGLSTIGLDSNR